MEQYYQVSDIVDQQEYFDGMLFRLKEVKPEVVVWSIITLDFTEGGKKVPEYVKSKFGHDKYKVVYFNEDGSIDYVECVLTDPKTYIKVLLESEQQGMVIRDCQEADEMLLKLMLTRFQKMLANLVERGYNYSPVE